MGVRSVAAPLSLRSQPGRRVHLEYIASLILSTKQAAMRGYAPPGSFARVERNRVRYGASKERGIKVARPAVVEETLLEKLFLSIHASEDWLFSGVPEKGGAQRERSPSGPPPGVRSGRLIKRGCGRLGLAGVPARARAVVRRAAARVRAAGKGGGAGRGPPPVVCDGPSATPPDRAYPEGRERPPQKATRRRSPGSTSPVFGEPPATLRQ